MCRHAPDAHNGNVHMLYSVYRGHQLSLLIRAKHRVVHSVHKPEYFSLKHEVSFRGKIVVKRFTKLLKSRECPFTPFSRNHNEFSQGSVIFSVLNDGFDVSFEQIPPERKLHEHPLRRTKPTSGTNKAMAAAREGHGAK